MNAGQKAQQITDAVTKDLTPQEILRVAACMLDEVAWSTLRGEVNEWGMLYAKIMDEGKDNPDAKKVNEV